MKVVKVNPEERLKKQKEELLRRRLSELEQRANLKWLETSTERAKQYFQLPGKYGDIVYPLERPEEEDRRVSMGILLGYFVPYLEKEQIDLNSQQVDSRYVHLIGLEIKSACKLYKTTSTAAGYMPICVLLSLDPDNDALFIRPQFVYFSQLYQMPSDASEAENSEIDVSKLSGSSDFRLKSIRSLKLPYLYQLRTNLAAMKLSVRKMEEHPDYRPRGKFHPGDLVISKMGFRRTYSETETLGIVGVEIDPSINLIESGLLSDEISNDQIDPDYYGFYCKNPVLTCWQTLDSGSIRMVDESDLIKVGNIDEL